MKNERLFPLERNLYFFGKLMTEREFEIEQAYGNNKRRLHNLALLNPGIVCGMTVTNVDRTAISVESGLALDGLGRELVLPELIMVLLSELDGFNDDTGHAGHVYLCAEYAEKPVKPVHVLGSESGQFGMVHETVRLFLRYGEPEPFEIGRLGFEDNRRESLEDKLERRARIVLHLARIHIIRWEEAYEIDSIEPAPFDQYAVIETQHTITAEATEHMHVRPPAASDPATPAAVAYGTAAVRIADGAKAGSVFYSSEITHGLGLVPAAVTLGLANADSAVFGDPAVFGRDTDYTFAARVNHNDGTFTIGVRLKRQTQDRIVRFIWSAAADPARVGVDNSVTPCIIVTPATGRIKPFETLRLTAERYGLPNGDIVWSVREPGGGEITAEGEYAAPADPGIYTVIARCGAVFATSIIVVTWG